MDFENRIVDLLVASNPEAARKFFLTWDEERSASWATAHHQATVSSASKLHVPALRGQLRHQLGENALASAAKAAGVGHFARPTEKPGAHMMLARIGRFALCSIKVTDRNNLPRESLTRTVLSRPNREIVPQSEMFAEPESTRGSLEELAYFGCLLAVPSTTDHSAPYGLYLAIPNHHMTEWIKTLSIETLHALMLNRLSGKGGSEMQTRQIIQDRAIPRIRVPKPNPARSADD